MAKRKNKKANFKNKWFLVAGAFIILFLVLYHLVPHRVSSPAFQQGSQKQTQTLTPQITLQNGSNIYQSKKFNFSVEIPSDWTANEESTGTLAPAVDMRNVAPFAGEINLYILDNPQKLSSEEYVKQEAFKNDLPEWKNIEKPHETIQVDGKSAVWFDLISGGSGDFQPVVYLANGDKVYYSQGRVEKDTFNQILSTFKFTQ